MPYNIEYGKTKSLNENMFKPCPLCGFGVFVEKINDNTNEPQRGLMFSEISQRQKDKYYMIPLK